LEEKSNGLCPSGKTAWLVGKTKTHSNFLKPQQHYCYFVLFNTLLYKLDFSVHSEEALMNSSEKSTCTAMHAPSLKNTSCIMDVWMFRFL
jgi:hypothetical protein